MTHALRLPVGSSCPQKHTLKCGASLTLLGRFRIRFQNRNESPKPSSAQWSGDRVNPLQGACLEAQAREVPPRKVEEILRAAERAGERLLLTSVVYGETTHNSFISMRTFKTPLCHGWDRRFGWFHECSEARMCVWVCVCARCNGDTCI